ncbi:hypothetical protein HEN51_015230 [Escherichia coli]|uniref:hypothetical protein n=1 Tax=Enterobacteriaceae TaxID=543 RepID=UPI00084C5693|nr:MULTISPECIES: hypothetical protein [Enterobacteriaceae]EFA6548983.1 hypothetical protein [Escherichia coli O157:H7]ELY2482184.1 hypothetical protein [Cronobacter sakazakii]OQD49218.1 hypothetical protein BWZ29_12385 [Enterobacter cancerogenus]AOP85261.1 hypothetical protein BFV64_02330 [Enterobacter kobei]EEW1969406.1 hypothetical protein [Escherichia coli]
MSPDEFRAWFASLPEKFQRQAKAMYDNARRGGGVHTASSLALIKNLIEGSINFEGKFPNDNHQ